MLVATADACSASRPGARRETLDRYIKRMEELEAIAAEFSGVEQAFAVRAFQKYRGRGTACMGQVEQEICIFDGAFLGFRQHMSLVGGHAQVGFIETYGSFSIYRALEAIVEDMVGAQLLLGFAHHGVDEERGD